MVVVEAPTLRPHAAVAAQPAAPRSSPSRSRRTASTSRRSPAALEAGARPKLAHIIPNFQNPAGYTLSLEKRRRLLELAERVRLRDLRGRPLRRAALRGRAAADDAVARRARTTSSTRRRSRRRSARASASATWRARSRLIAEIQKIATETYISPNMVAAVDRQRVLPLGRDRPLDRDRQERAARAPRRALRARSSASCPRRASSRPQGGYFLWVDLPEGTDVDALRGAAQERGVVFVKGTDFLLEGGQNSLRIAYSGVHAGPDRRRRGAPGRGLPELAGAAA